jgi:hypothetical protein
MVPGILASRPEWSLSLRISMLPGARGKWNESVPPSWYTDAWWAIDQMRRWKTAPGPPGFRFYLPVQLSDGGRIGIACSVRDDGTICVHEIVREGA